MISTLFKHKSLILTLCTTAYIACGTIGYACSIPPECDTPDRYVMWASKNGAVFAQSEDGDSVFLDYYASPNIVKYILVGQNYTDGRWEPFVEWFDYSYGTAYGCGDCTANQCSFTYSGGVQTALFNTTSTIEYSQQPLAGYVSGTHNGWDCDKDGWGSYQIPASQQVTMNVYVVKVDITRNGVSIADQNPTVSVGEKISLAGNVEPAVITGTSPLWDIDNFPIKNYIANTSEGRVVYLTPLDRTSQLIDYYWYVGNEDVYVGYTVIINGHSWGTSTNFDVKKPTAIVAIDTSNTMWIDGLPVRLDISFGNYSSGIPAGIFILRTNYSLNGATNGDFLWVQLIDSLRRQHIVSNQKWEKIDTNAYVLDTTYPYDDRDEGTGDSPHKAVEGTVVEDPIDEFYSYETFETWLMYEPSSPNSIRVPIHKVNWYWTVHVRDQQGWGIESEDWTNDNNSAGAPSDQYPVWSRNIKDLEYVEEQ